MASRNLVCVFTLCLAILFTLPGTMVGAEPLQVTKQDLTFLGFEPNQEIEQVVKKFKKNYPTIPIDPFEDDGQTSYLSGDPTPAMAYFLELAYDGGQLTGVDYRHFKIERSGFPFKTSRGIQAGSGIQAVYEKYGKQADVTRSNEPDHHYIDVSYDFVLQDTHQRGTLTFMLRHKKLEAENQAKVWGIQYKLQPGSTPKTAQQQDGSILIDGAKVVNGRTLVPLRAIFEQLGAEVNWDGAAQTIHAIKGNTEIQLQVNSSIALKNNSQVTLDTAPQMISGKTMVPLRFIGESLGAEVIWDGSVARLRPSSSTTQQPTIWDRKEWQQVTEHELWEKYQLAYDIYFRTSEEAVFRPKVQDIAGKYNYYTFVFRGTIRNQLLESGKLYYQEEGQPEQLFYEGSFGSNDFHGNGTIYLDGKVAWKGQFQFGDPIFPTDLAAQGTERNEALANEKRQKEQAAQQYVGQAMWSKRITHQLEKLEKVYVTEVKWDAGYYWMTIKKQDQTTFQKKLSNIDNLVEDFSFTNPRNEHKWSESIWNAISHEEIQIGMTQQQVIMSWGGPTYGRKGLYHDGSTYEIWPYGVYQNGNVQTLPHAIELYFKDGILERINPDDLASDWKPVPNYYGW